MPWGRMIEVRVRADLKRVLGEPEKLFIHALSPEVGVPNPRGDNDCYQNGSGDRDPRLPSLGCDLPVGWQWRNLRQYWQRTGFDQVGLAANAIVDELHADSKHERQRQARAQPGKREFEAVGERRLLGHAGRIDNAELIALLLLV